MLWLPEPDGGLVAQSVWSASAGLAAEIEGLRVESLERAATVVRARLDESAEEVTVPFDAAEGGGAIELARRGRGLRPRRDARRACSRPSSSGSEGGSRGAARR